jgi:Na+/H+-translocating membrane pyrophosphatase
MLIATQTNSKTAYLARISLDQAFKIAYKGASIIGFSLVAI